MISIGFYAIIPDMETVDKNIYFKDMEAKDARIAELEAALAEANSRADISEASLAKMEKLRKDDENTISTLNSMLSKMANDIKKFNEQLFLSLTKTYCTKADVLLKTRKGLISDLSKDADGEVFPEGAGEGISKFMDPLGRNGRAIDSQGKKSRRERKQSQGKRQASKPREPLLDIDLPAEHIYCDTSEKLEELIAQYGQENIVRMSEDVTVFIEMSPMVLKKVIVHKGKFSVKGHPEAGIAKAPPYPRMLPKTKIGDNMLAAIIADKFIYRVSYAMCTEMFKTCGYNFDRREFSRWQIQATEQLEPLYKLIQEHLRTQDCLQMDETPVVIDTPKNKDKHKNYIWSMQITNVDKPAAWFTLGPGRNGEVALEMLGDFEGYLQSDGYSAYSKIAKMNPNIISVACAAHMRRKFVEAFNVSGGNNVTAEQIVGEFDDIFDDEWELRRDFKEGKLNKDEFLKNRKDVTVPHIESIRKLAGQKPVNNEGSNLESPKYEDAASYCLKHLDALKNFLDKVELSPSNNLSERGFKDITRLLDSCYKFGSERGAHSACVIFTLLRSATLNRLDPHCYLRYVMVHASKILSQATETLSWEDLLPWNVDREDEVFHLPDFKKELEKLS